VDGVPRVPVDGPAADVGAVNIYRLSSWTRATLVPFALLMVHRPEVRVPPEADVRELGCASRRRATCRSHARRRCCRRNVFWLDC
jgi:hypothetical protein